MNAPYYFLAQLRAYLTEADSIARAKVTVAIPANEDTVVQAQLAAELEALTAEYVAELQRAGVGEVTALPPVAAPLTAGQYWSCTHIVDKEGA